MTFSAEMMPCGGCKRLFPITRLRRLWRIHRIAEGELLYCRRCAISQNLGVVLLATLFSFVIAIGVSQILRHGLFTSWAALSIYTKFVIFVIIAGLLVAIADAATSAYRKYARRRESEKVLAPLMALPPVEMDFTTPEGAILCLEHTYRSQDIEAAVACRDFTTQARLWLQEQSSVSKEMQIEMLPEMTKTMERSYRETWVMHPRTGWERPQSYFVMRELYADGVVVVSEITLGPDGSLFRQRILVAETPEGWRVVTELAK